VQAQELVPATLPDLSKSSKRTEATPTPKADKPSSKPSVEISAETPNPKPTPAVEETPPPEELATPAATVEKNRPRVRRHAFAQPNAPLATPTSLSTAKTVATSAPLPDYPYEARRAHITGSGVCVMFVDTASGTVARAVMTQSTGNAILDKVTTDTFGRWRFKPGTVSQVQVPITYQ
jgi:TonB family protein